MERKGKVRKKRKEKWMEEDNCSTKKVKTEKLEKFNGSLLT